jgi:hypothetical protein
MLPSETHKDNEEHDLEKNRDNGERIDHFTSCPLTMFPPEEYTEESSKRGCANQERSRLRNPDPAHHQKSSSDNCSGDSTINV